MYEYVAYFVFRKILWACRSRESRKTGRRYERSLSRWYGSQLTSQKYDTQGNIRSHSNNFQSFLLKVKKNFQVIDTLTSIPQMLFTAEPLSKFYLLLVTPNEKLKDPTIIFTDTFLTKFSRMGFLLSMSSPWLNALGICLLVTPYRKAIKKLLHLQCTNRVVDPNQNNHNNMFQLRAVQQRQGSGSGTTAFHTSNNRRSSSVIENRIHYANFRRNTYVDDVN